MTQPDPTPPEPELSAEEERQRSYIIALNSYIVALEAERDSLRAELAARERRIAEMEERLRQSQRGRAYDRVIEDIKSERELQDHEWGGPEHDDQHDLADWLVFINKQAMRAEEPGYDPRECMVKLAALAVAAIESMDRKAAR